MTTETLLFRWVIGHRWAIQPPDGPTSWGVCRSCGETREFKNHIDVENWKEKGVKSAAAKKAQAEMLAAEREYQNLGMPFALEN